jgi:hypothetical protein
LNDQPLYVVSSTFSFRISNEHFLRKTWCLTALTLPYITNCLLIFLLDEASKGEVQKYGKVENVAFKCEGQKLLTD